MKSLSGVFICSILIIVCFVSQAQLPSLQQQAITLKRQVQRNHYSPRGVNDSLSADIFRAFIKRLDGQHDIFIAGEYNTLASFRYQLDDELNGGSWQFLDLATKTYRKALQRADSIVKDILQKPLDFQGDEKIIFSKADSGLFAKDIKELRQKWTRWFKYVMLSHAYNTAASDSTRPLLKDVLAKNESSFRDKFSKGQSKLFHELLDPAGFEKEIKEIYFNAIASCFDPHTNYFSPHQQEEFQSELSVTDYSFGFEMEETREGNISISQLIPGGPAWKTGELHKDDELLQLQWKGKPAVDVAAIDMEDVEDMLATSNHDELIIKVRKTNGTVRTVSLRKEKIEMEEDVVKGYLLSGEKKIGYISLPDFYTTWEDETGSGCANDMAKEIIKMKKENPDGLILDVRYNGGGSLHEALQLCGIFIDEGPLVGIRGKDMKLTFYRDPNRGIIYDGPLLVMVNNQSASASEMLAAALQDYNRAVIVGSPTYGKATMQEVMPMDSMATKKATSPNGFVKLTTGKLYRLNGETAQCNGVIPDIVLPDAFDGLEYREKFIPHVLPADTAKRNSYYKPLAALPLAALSASSRERTSKDPSFSALSQGISRRMAELSAGKTIIPLQPALFEKWMKEKEAAAKALDEQEEAATKLFTAGNYRMEKERLQNNAFATELNAAALENIQGDMYVREAYRIITDLINLTKK